MSIDYLKFVNNVVDKEEAEFYLVNKRRRAFWHSKSLSISCRVREKNPLSNSVKFAMNIRAYLLSDEKDFHIALSETMKDIIRMDQHQLRMYAYSKFRDMDPLMFEKNIGLIIRSLSDEEIRAALDLKEVVSCRLLGYEKELIYLKCYSKGILPVFMLRCLYHLNFSHKEFKQIIESEQMGDIEKGLEFEYYLDRVKFL